jgi:hypothetical protein
MKYVPNLIPENAKVLPDYFNDTPNITPSVSFLKKFICTAGAVWFFMFAMACYKEPLVCVIMLVLAAGLLVPVHRWIERKLQFTFTTAIKAVVYFILLVPFFISRGQEGEKLQQLQLIAQEKEASDKQEQQRLLAVQDSLFKDSLDREMATRKEHVSRYMQEKRYQEAKEEIDFLLLGDEDNTTLLYQRAQCNDEMGFTKEAVQDLVLAMKLGSTEANALHEKINPERKRISGYVTACCDGSYSDAKGRGACSHHGGVCNWNEPVYEQYREFK